MGSKSFLDFISGSDCIRLILKLTLLYCGLVNCGTGLKTLAIQ